MVQPITRVQPRGLRRRARAVVVCVLLVVGFLLHGLHRINQQRKLDPTDTTAYLQEAHFIAERGGPVRMLGLLVSGRYGFDNRQPLYPWVLSWFAVRDFAFLARAKLASLAAGLVCFLLTLLATRRLADNLTALIVGLLLLFAFTFFRLTSMVACESLLMVFVVGWWFAAAAALKRPQWWPLAGLLAGAAFVTKGSGLFLVGVTLLTVLIRRRRLLRSGWFWLFFVGFVAAAWPLLVRNVRLFGNPVHNVNAATMWADHWEDTYRPEFKTHPPGPLDYLRTHTVRQIADRVGFGVVGQAQMLFEALHVVNLPAMQDPENPDRMVGAPFVISGVLVLGLAGVGLAGERRRDLAALTAISVVVFFVFFAWYHQVVQAARFMLPVAPLIFFYAARGMVWLWVRLWGLRPLRIGAAGLLGLTVLYLAALPIGNPLTSYDVPPGYESLRDWIRANIADDEPFVLGPTHIYRFRAYTPDFPDRQYALPALTSMRELRDWLRERDVRIVVIDIESFRRTRRLLGEYLWCSEKEGLRPLRPIPGWRLVERARGTPTRYLMFEVGARAGRGPESP